MAIAAEHTADSRDALIQRLSEAIGSSHVMSGECELAAPYREDWTASTTEALWLSYVRRQLKKWRPLLKLAPRWAFPLCHLGAGLGCAAGAFLCQTAKA